MQPSINAFDPKFDGVAPYDVVWSLGVQRELPYSMFLSASYTGNRGNRLPAQLNPINQIPSAYLAKYGSKLGEPFATTGASLGVPFLTRPSTRIFQLLRCFKPYAPTRSTPASSTTSI